MGQRYTGGMSQTAESCNGSAIAWNHRQQPQNQIFSQGRKFPTGCRFSAMVFIRWMRKKRNVAYWMRSLRSTAILILHRHMVQNIDVFDFALSAEDMEAIKALDQGESLFFSHYDPDTVEFLTGLGK